MQPRFSLTFRGIAVSILFSFLFNTVFQSTGFAQVANLPVTAPVVVPPTAGAPIAIGLNLYRDDPMKFDFIIDSGAGNNDPERPTGVEGFPQGEITQDADKLIKYFLASLTTPQEEMWVNLNPQEADRIVPEAFGQTEMGRDLLAQDYILKQLTASLISPETEVGEKFWDGIYGKIYESDKRDKGDKGDKGNSLAVNNQEGFDASTTFNNLLSRVWIVPQTAKLYEHEKGVFIVESKLRVQLDASRNSVTMRQCNNDEECTATLSQANAESDVTLSHLKDIILPEIEKQVNEGEAFAPLRQIYNSMILALWYKQKIVQMVENRKEKVENSEENLTSTSHPLSSYIDQHKTAGIDVNDPQTAKKIFDQYLESFKQGVNELIKEEYDPKTQQIVPRKYITGGASLDQAALAITHGRQEAFNAAQHAQNPTEVVFTLQTPDEAETSDAAMVSEKFQKRFEQMRAEAVAKEIARKRKSFKAELPGFIQSQLRSDFPVFYGDKTIYDVLFTVRGEIAGFVYKNPHLSKDKVEVVLQNGEVYPFDEEIGAKWSSLFLARKKIEAKGGLVFYPNQDDDVLVVDPVSGGILYDLRIQRKSFIWSDDKSLKDVMAVSFCPETGNVSFLDRVLFDAQPSREKESVRTAKNYYFVVSAGKETDVLFLLTSGEYLKESLNSLVSAGKLWREISEFDAHGLADPGVVLYHKKFDHWFVLAGISFLQNGSLSILYLPIGHQLWSDQSLTRNMSPEITKLLGPIASEGDADRGTSQVNPLVREYDFAHNQWGDSNALTLAGLSDLVEKNKIFPDLESFNSSSDSAMMGPSHVILNILVNQIREITWISPRKKWLMDNWISECEKIKEMNAAKYEVMQIQTAVSAFKKSAEELIELSERAEDWDTVVRVVKTYQDAILKHNLRNQDLLLLKTKFPTQEYVAKAEAMRAKRQNKAMEVVRELLDLGLSDNERTGILAALDKEPGKRHNEIADALLLWGKLVSLKIVRNMDVDFLLELFKQNKIDALPSYLRMAFSLYRVRLNSLSFLNRYYDALGWWIGLGDPASSYPFGMQVVKKWILETESFNEIEQMSRDWWRQAQTTKNMIHFNAWALAQLKQSGSLDVFGLDLAMMDPEFVKAQVKDADAAAMAQAPFDDSFSTSLNFFKTDAVSIPIRFFEDAAKNERMLSDAQRKGVMEFLEKAKKIDSTKKWDSVFSESYQAFGQDPNHALSILIGLVYKIKRKLPRPVVVPWHKTAFDSLLLRWQDPYSIDRQKLSELVHEFLAENNQSIHITRREEKDAISDLRKQLCEWILKRKFPVSLIENDVESLAVQLMKFFKISRDEIFPGDFLVIADGDVVRMVRDLSFWDVDHETSDSAMLYQLKKSLERLSVKTESTESREELIKQFHEKNQDLLFSRSSDDYYAIMRAIRKSSGETIQAAELFIQFIRFNIISFDNVDFLVSLLGSHREQDVPEFLRFALVLHKVRLNSASFLTSVKENFGFWREESYFPSLTMDAVKELMAKWQIGEVSLLRNQIEDMAFDGEFSPNRLNLFLYEQGYALENPNLFSTFIPTSQTILLEFSALANQILAMIKKKGQRELSAWSREDADALTVLSGKWRDLIATALRISQRENAHPVDPLFEEADKDLGRILIEEHPDSVLLDSAFERFGSIVRRGEDVNLGFDKAQMNAKEFDEFMGKSTKSMAKQKANELFAKLPSFIQRTPRAEKHPWIMVRDGKPILESSTYEQDGKDFFWDDILFDEDQVRGIVLRCKNPDEKKIIVVLEEEIKNFDNEADFRQSELSKYFSAKAQRKLDSRGDFVLFGSASKIMICDENGISFSQDIKEGDKVNAQNAGFIVVNPETGEMWLEEKKSGDSYRAENEESTDVPFFIMTRDQEKKTRFGVISVAKFNANIFRSLIRAKNLFGPLQQVLKENRMVAGVNFPLFLERENLVLSAIFYGGVRGGEGALHVFYLPVGNDLPGLKEKLVENPPSNLEEEARKLLRLPKNDGIVSHVISVPSDVLGPVTVDVMKLVRIVTKSEFVYDISDAAQMNAEPFKNLKNEVKKSFAARNSQMLLDALPGFIKAAKAWQIPLQSGLCERQERQFYWDDILFDEKQVKAVVLRGVDEKEKRVIVVTEDGEEILQDDLVFQKSAYLRYFSVKMRRGLDSGNNIVLFGNASKIMICDENGILFSQDIKEGDKVNARNAMYIIVDSETGKMWFDTQKAIKSYEIELGDNVGMDIFRIQLDPQNYRLESDLGLPLWFRNGDIFRSLLRARDLFVKLQKMLKENRIFAGNSVPLSIYQEKTNFVLSAVFLTENQSPEKNELRFVYLPVGNDLPGLVEKVRKEGRENYQKIWEFLGAYPSANKEVWIISFSDEKSRPNAWSVDGLIETIQAGRLVYDISDAAMPGEVLNSNLQEPRIAKNPGGSADFNIINGEISPTSADVGGIDLNMQDVDVQVDGAGLFEMNFDPIMIQKIQNAPGLVPVIINITPIADLPMFLGLVDTEQNNPIVDLPGKVPPADRIGKFIGV